MKKKPQQIQSKTSKVKGKNKKRKGKKEGRDEIGNILASGIHF